MKVTGSFPCVGILTGCTDRPSAHSRADGSKGWGHQGYTQYLLAIVGGPTASDRFCSNIKHLQVASPHVGVCMCTPYTARHR